MTTPLPSQTPKELHPIARGSCPVKPSTDGQVRVNNLTRNGTIALDPNMIVEFRGETYGCFSEDPQTIAEALAWQIGIPPSKCIPGAFRPDEIAVLHVKAKDDWATYHLPLNDLLRAA